MTAAAWVIFATAAVLEVAGDAAIRKGLRGGGLAVIGVGVAVLGTYGLVVNLVPWNFSKLLGVYVGFFAIVSVVVGRVVFGEQIRLSALVGLTLIIAGGLVLQLRD